MTCRHRPGDPDCSSHPDHPNNYLNYSKLKPSSTVSVPSITPDSKNYTIKNVQHFSSPIGEALVIFVQYPNCSLCAYEGTKTLVYFGVTPVAAMMWREIDPHFADPKQVVMPNKAPSPSARFPGDSTGWSDALLFVKMKLKIRE